MDTFSLQAFVEAADRQSFSLAAERLHLTQPAISKRIASLEQKLNCKLFDRINRSIQLTEAGSALLPQARAILLAVKQAEQSIVELHGQVSGRLRLATSHHIGLHRLPPVLKQFSKHYPQVHLDIEFIDSEQAQELLQQGHIELAIVTLAPHSSDHIKQIPLWVDHLQAVCAPDHPLGARQPLRLQDLSEFPAILPGLNTYTGEIIKTLFQQHALALNISMASHYLETIKAMTLIGLGWSVLPSNMLEGLRRLELGEIALSRQLGCAHHSERSLSNAARKLIAMLEENADRP